MRSEMLGKTRAMPNSASRSSAAQRPTSLARTAQPPPTAASVATMAKVAGHPGEHRQGAAREAAVGAREHERQHRQDARAEDGQHAAEISEQDDQHGVALSEGGGAKLQAERNGAYQFHACNQS